MGQHMKDVYNFSNTSSKEQFIYHDNRTEGWV